MGKILHIGEVMNEADREYIAQIRRILDESRKLCDASWEILAASRRQVEYTKKNTGEMMKDIIYVQCCKCNKEIPRMKSTFLASKDYICSDCLSESLKEKRAQLHREEQERSDNKARLDAVNGSDHA